MSWLLFIVLSACAVALSLWQYHRRETPGRGRTLLALLRATSLGVLLLVIFDPELPGTAGAGVSGDQVLLDASLSMGLSDRWEAARAAATENAGDRPILLFGDRARPIHADSLATSTPQDSRTLLLPALQAAAEAGVRKVIVVTDGGIEDADAVARWAPRLGIEVATELVGADVANRVLSEIPPPQWAQADSPVSVEFGVSGGAATDSVRVIARRAGQVIARATVPGAGAGRVATGRLEMRLSAPEGGGWVPIEIALEDTDAVPDDNSRTLMIQVSNEPAGIALLSLRPDWEPRHLAPVLEQAVGLPLRAWLRGATGQYVRLAGGLDAGAPVTEDVIRRALDRADLVVLHGLGLDAPQWAIDVAGRSGRILIFPADDASQLPLPVPTGVEFQGDFFLTATIPPSPVAPLFAEMDVSGLAPLTGLRPVEPPEGTWTPLLATRGRSGASQPVLLAGASGGRRWAIALGSGYWQWSFRGGNERAVYTRFWSAVAGWLARERGIASLPAVRPASMTVPRGAAVPWVTPGIVADSIALTLTGSGDVVVLDTVITAAVGDSAYSLAPPPGSYRYRARAFSADSVTSAEGTLVVETYSPEFSRPRADLSTVSGPGAAESLRDTSGRRGTPLHATAYPYGLIVILLAAEWILRRRWGLR